MKKKPHHSKAQARALRHFQRAGSAAAAAREHKYGPTKAQSAAARHNLATARAVVAARRAHKKLPVKKPKLSPFEVNCCSAEAVAASLRLAAVPVGPEDMLSLYWAVTQDPEGGATLEEILAAASVRGLAGWYPSYAPAATPAVGMVMSWDVWEHAAALGPHGLVSWGETVPWVEPPDDAWQITWHK